MNKKRCRSVNWDEEEKQLLRFVLRDHANVIENKAIDTKTIKLKNKAWEEVYKKFNELNVRHRNIIQLKIQWKTMKLKARKRRKIKRELGEATAATFNDAVIEIKDLYNPEETLKQNNLKPMAFVDTCVNDNITQQSQQIADCITYTIENIEAEVDNQKICTPLLRISKDIFKNPQVEKNMGTIPVKEVPRPNVMPNIPENGTHGKDVVGEVLLHITVIRKRAQKTGTIATLKGKANYLAKERASPLSPDHVIYTNENETVIVAKGSLEYGWTDLAHEDHVSSIINHIKSLKEEEHRRRLEMAEEEHSLKIAIQIEKLKSATIEREILELKQARELRLDLNNT